MDLTNELDDGDGKRAEAATTASTLATPTATVNGDVPVSSLGALQSPSTDSQSETRNGKDEKKEPDSKSAKKSKSKKGKSAASPAKKHLPPVRAPYVKKSSPASCLNETSEQFRAVKALVHDIEAVF